MTDKPTHKHKVTGDIVFWGDHLEIKDFELLPSDHWIKTDTEAKRLGNEKGLREAKFKNWTIEELAVYFENEIAKLSSKIGVK